MCLHDRKIRADAPRLRNLLAAIDHCKTCSGMTFARHQCSKLMSRDVSLIGLLRYLPLAQFIKARSVNSLGPFSLAFPRNRFCHGPRLPATRGYTAHTLTAQEWARVPARLFESPRHSGANDEGVTPRLLWMSLPGAAEDRRPTRMPPGPSLGPLVALT